MKRQLFLSILIIAGLFAGLSGFGQGTDIPGWRGAARDGKVTGFKAPATWPKELTQVWAVSVGLGDASPILVGDKVYLLVRQESDEALICVDTKDGKLLWKTVINPAPEITGPASSHPGPRSTPYYSDGKIFTLGAKGMVACHDAKSGKLIWKNEAYTSEVPQFFTGSSPLVVDKMCIVPLGGKEHGVVVALDVKSGKEIWKLESAPCTYSSPLTMTFDKKIIVDQSETDVLGISMDGKLLWKIPTPGQRMYYNAPTPVIDGQNIVIAGSGIGTKMFEVKKEGDNYTTNELWINSKIGASFNTPVLKDGFLYGNDARFGYVYSINAKTGETAWADTIKLNRFASVLDLGKSILSLTGNATMVVFEPTGAGYKELAKYKVSDTEIYAHPLAVDNKIFVKDKEKLTCWLVK